ncbi:serine hydrolase domain-containing protein [Sorangium sp. So ce726]|uniref:serine hydrolase domain-containing protein n=1 Tax=Sorangium sp. So ce726 TaxID=3133319 RepID=UPI003F64783A
MVVRKVGASWLAAIALLGCGTSNPISAVSPAPPPAPAVQAFEPGTADPQRKARLVALAGDLDELFRTKLEETGATALAAGILVDGELVYQQALGVRDVASGAPVDADSVFRIGSLSKSFTALSVLKLRDEGKLSLDAPAERYVPELSLLVPPTADSPPITPRLLLTNAAGLAYDDLWGAVTFGQSDQQLNEVLRAGVRFSSVPGTKYAYSNLGWALLGKVVERASGVKFRDYVTANVLRPLGMNATVWEASDVPPARLAIGYRREKGALVPEPRPSDGVFAPAGGLYTSLHDYARYVAFNVMAYPPRDDAEAGPVRRSTLREMHAGQRWSRNSDKDAPVLRRAVGGLRLSASNYGFGWTNVTTCTEEGRVQHGGFEPGYFATVMLLPRERVALFVLSTTAAVGKSSNAAVFEVLRAGGVLTPPVLQPTPALEAARTAIDHLLDSWNPGVFQAAFDPQSAMYSWNADLPAKFEALARDHGACRSRTPIEAYNGSHGGWRSTCKRGAIEFEVMLAPTTPPRVQALLWRQQFPLDEETRGTAAVLAGAVGHGLSDRSSEWISPSADVVPTVRLLHQLEADHGFCELEDGVIEIEHAPLSTQTRALRLKLACTRGPMELLVGLNEADKIVSLSGYAPHAPDATCWL